MKFSLLLLSVYMAAELVSAVSNHSDKRHVLINRPKIDEFGPRERRAAHAWPLPLPLPLARSDGVKGGVKGYRPVVAPPSALEMKVRKGEYVCGDKICKLEPGVEPIGCNGICQYPVLK